MMKWVLVLLCLPFLGNSQTGDISGSVVENGSAIAFATVTLNAEKLVYSDENGQFLFEDLPFGDHELVVSFLGYQDFVQQVELSSQQPNLSLNFALEKQLMVFDEIVVTGTKTFKRQTQSAVIVNVVDSKTLEKVQACNLSEGLRFQPGLRVENNCQTCNYTQLRMNGLAGGYSQILINGRPIFSPLTGLYGLEQIPVNMIDRIEVIRGGGSSLYGSSAIGGTVNVLTKIPSENTFTINSMYQNINGGAADFMLNGNATVVSQNKKSGLSFFLNQRNREAYDHNGDSFSELPEIANTSAGVGGFWLPTENQKVEFSLTKMHEYRYGGELIDAPANLVQQAEERTHNVWAGSLDYQINFNDGATNLITYAAFQYTDRNHFTGVLPDDPTEASLYLEKPPYGTSATTTLNTGIQLNHSISDFFLGSNVFTLGTEIIYDDTFDEIPAYNYLIDQTTRDIGVFMQSDWELLPSLNLLSGVRIDDHNLVDGLIASPRISLLYRYKENTQIRASYGTGFRAPQAFDTDLHIAFAGGGVSRVQLSPSLLEETSDSYSLSINYDKPTEHWVAGFTVEGFHTRLNDAFILQPIGEDNFGELFEKQNGQGAEVTGATLELRANYNKKIQLESGLTLQSSRFDQPVQYIDELEGFRDFVRTPNAYGFANLSLFPSESWTINLNYVHTGGMIVPHFGGASNQPNDEIFNAPAFHELSGKVSYTTALTNAYKVELYAGVRNIANSYQSSFDIGKNRDSNFVFGPGLPRSIYVGAALRYN